MILEPKERIILAVDTSDLDEANRLITELAPYVGGFKIGLEFIHSMIEHIIFADPEDVLLNTAILRRLFSLMSGKIFWDGKFNDIPNTVAGASAIISRFKVKFFNVHVSSGFRALQDAAKEKGEALLLAVTLLTSLDSDEIKCIFGKDRKEKFLEMAVNAFTAGVDGIISSYAELGILAEYSDALFNNLIKVVPGVRPKWAVANDQKRYTTPKEAIYAGADYLVIGRPITSPPKEVGESLCALKLIEEEIAAALSVYTKL